MDEARTVFCGNLSDKVTEELLFELFLQAAPLERVKIPTDKEGRRSNFGFVTFKHVESVNYALHLLNGIRLYDKTILVKPRHSNLPNRSQEQTISPTRFGRQLNEPYNRPIENRDVQNSRVHSRERHNESGNKRFRDNYRDQSFSRYDDRERHERYDNRKRQNYNDRRGNYNDRGHRNRNNRYY